MKLLLLLAISLLPLGLTGCRDDGYYRHGRIHRSAYYGHAPRRVYVNDYDDGPYYRSDYRGRSYRGGYRGYDGRGYGGYRDGRHGGYSRSSGPPVYVGY